jgi:hypothetical protein
MKAIYISSKQSPKQKKQMLTISSLLQNAGHKIDSILIDEVEITTSFNLEKNYQKNISALKKTDFVIAEITNMSSGLFFLIASALNEKKPVLALNGNTSNPISEKNLLSYANKNKLFSYFEYNEKTIGQKISGYLAEVKKIIDTKFILIISPQIDQYLEWASTNRRMHKAQVVRRAVEQVMTDDKEYKKILTKEKRSVKK